MHKKSAILLSVFLAGCEAKIAVSEDSAFLAGQVAGVSAEAAMRQFAPPAVSGACKAGTFTDADADGWPDSATTLSWSNCSMQSPLGMITMSGGMTVADMAVGTRSLDFAASALSLTGTVIQADEGVDATFSTEGSITGTAPSSMTWDATQEWGGEIDDRKSNIDETIGWTVVYTAGGWQPGSPLIDGTATFDGKWTANVNGDRVKSDVRTIDAVWESGPVVISASCDSKITAGVLRIKFNNGGRGANIDVIWNGCNDRTVHADL